MSKIDELKQQLAEADKIVLAEEIADPDGHHTNPREANRREKLARQLLKAKEPPTVLSVRAIVGVLAMFLTLTLIARLVGR